MHTITKKSTKKAWANAIARFDYKTETLTELFDSDNYELLTK
jgi:hypothetical protein